MVVGYTTITTCELCLGEAYFEYFESCDFSRENYLLSGCELIDTENISLPSQNMKLEASERNERVTNFIFCQAG
jgi:hypothetical protein